MVTYFERVLFPPGEGGAKRRMRVLTPKHFGMLSLTRRRAVHLVLARLRRAVVRETVAPWVSRCSTHGYFPSSPIGLRISARRQACTEFSQGWERQRVTTGLIWGRHAADPHLKNHATTTTPPNNIQ